MEDNSDLVPVVVDLGVRRKNELNEGWIDMFAGQVMYQAACLFRFVAPLRKLNLLQTP